MTSAYLARRHLGRRLGASAALVVLVALTSGSVMALVAGSRLTSSVFPEFVRYSEPESDVTVFAQLDDSVPFEVDEQEGLVALLDGLPEVERSVRGTFLIARGVDRAGDRQRLLAALPIDGELQLLFGRPHVVEGTWPDDGDADAIAIDEELAARADVEVGDRYRFAPYTLDQFGPAGEGADIEPAGPAQDLRVDAIYRYPADLQPRYLDQDGIYVDHSGIHLTPAYWDEHGPDLARYGIGVVVDLAEGTTAADLEATLQARIPDRFMLEFDSINGPTDGLTGIERAIDVQARGMVAVATITGFTGGALVLLLLGRRSAAERGRDRVLAGLGMAAPELTRVAALEGLVVGLAGAIPAAIGAIVASRWIPFGLAARADLDPGMEVDPVVLSIGVVATATLVTVGSALAARRRTVPAFGRPSRLASSAASGGMPPSAVVGLRFALQRSHDGRGLPVRSAMAGVAAATAVILTALVLVASFELVREEPERRGTYGDAVVGNFASVEASEVAAERLAANDDIVAFTGETNNEVTFGDRRAWISTYFPRHGDLRPFVVDGRVPSADDEIALGRQVMDRLGVGIGDVVDASFSGEPIPLRVVGQALVEDVDGANGGPGKSGLVSEAAWRRIDPLGQDQAGPTWFVVSIADDVDRAAALDRLAEEFPNAVTTPRMPADLVNIEQLGGLLVVLTVLVGLLGTGAAALAMFGAVMRRRRDLAVLRTIGLTRRQARATIAWQATAYALVGLLAGIPLGIAAGSWGWTIVAEGVGIAADPVVSPVGVVGVVLGVIVFLNVVGALPAWRARRLRPADVLRAE